jgi:hypothetical protein
MSASSMVLQQLSPPLRIATQIHDCCDKEFHWVESDKAAQTESDAFGNAGCAQTGDAKRAGNEAFV